MDHSTGSENEIESLRMLCDGRTTQASRVELLVSLKSHPFLNHEHEVVFESICFLLPRGPILRERLTVHLNNRGFPDIDLDKYFSTTLADDVRRETP